jgi:5-methylthioadenosine/S-adenosylhomocysteine deaminase
LLLAALLPALSLPEAPAPAQDVPAATAPHAEESGMSILIKNILLNDQIQDVYIEDKHFKSIGPSLDVTALELIDGSDMAILPSFINAHTHAAMTLLRGYADDLELHTWLQDHIWPFESQLTFDDIYIGAKLACLEMIKTGTTFFCDMYWHLPATLKAVYEMGIRAALSSVFIDFNDPKKAKDFRARTRKFFREKQSHERVIFTLGPHAIYTVSKDSLTWLKDFADENELLIHIHVSETRKEVHDCLKMHDMRPVKYLESIGFLGPNVIACHSVWVNEEEMDILAGRDVKVVHNPVSNMKLGSGSFPFKEMSQRRICLGLGTDGCSSNNNLNMLEEMKIAALQAKLNHHDPTLFTADQALECATLGGARIFGLDMGKIAVGMLADCILINLNHYSLLPRHDLISNLVYSASSESIDTTICNGQILMRNRKVPGEEKIVEEVKIWENKHKNSP